MTSSSSASTVRIVLLVLLLAVAATVATDFRHSAAAGPVTALRNAETHGAEEEGGSVAPFCGFAPCGMPLECDPAR